jgi:peptidase E
MQNRNKNTKRKAVFIGGGDILSGKQDEIFLKLFSDFGSKPLKLLYLPFALFGDDKKANTMSDYMSLLEGHLRRLKNNLHFDWVSRGESQTNAVNKIKAADIIFLSGGDTEFLIDYLKRTGLIKEISEFYENGGIVIGNSAGCLALVHTGYSYFESKKKKYQGVGIIQNFIPAVHWKKEYKMEPKKENTNMIMLEENKGCIIVNDNDIKMLN